MAKNAIIKKSKKSKVQEPVVETEQVAETIQVVEPQPEQSDEKPISRKRKRSMDGIVIFNNHFQIKNLKKLIL